MEATNPRGEQVLNRRPIMKQNRDAGSTGVENQKLNHKKGKNYGAQINSNENMYLRARNRIHKRRKKEEIPK